MRIGSQLAYAALIIGGLTGEVRAFLGEDDPPRIVAPPPTFDVCPAEVANADVVTVTDKVC